VNGRQSATHSAQVLLPRWHALWRELGAEPDETLFRDIVARYGEPHRRYHTLRHLEECFDAFDAVRGEARHPAEVELALWFHDAIYDATSKDNERRSAEWARSAIAGAGLPEEVGERVYAMVMATRHDAAAPATADERILVDVDLSILGSEPERFEEYERQVREEYSWVPEPVFAGARRAILQGFIARPHLYETALFRDALESRARQNLLRSIARLSARAQHNERKTMAEENVKALTFDVFGTVVDWHGSVAREVRELAKAKGLRVNAVKFTKAWRAGYRPAMDRVRSGELPWTKIDVLHRMILDGLLSEFRIADALTEEEKAHLNKVWHRLKPWPDSPKGLKRLKKKFIIATLSNGNTGLLVNMAKQGNLPWDCIFSSETFRHFKPDPEMYLGAADALDLQPSEVMMVASHKHDLRAAAQHGLKTAFIKRPHEYGRNNNPDLQPEAEFTINADDFVDLAQKLGA
jgi:2-haloacid dehalogenase